MVVITSKEALRSCIAALKKEGKRVGFVPTMGALHEGHLSLVRHSVAENDATICSIFVNPIQFNNKEDLEKYPKTLSEDTKLLEKEKCNIVFAPSVEEMYPENPSENYRFEGLDNILEGSFREGHFNGVAIVVKRLFDMVQPNNAYFGKKDYQQLLIIQKLVEKEQMPIHIIPCPIIREDDGLAMSSRNRRLTTSERALAPKIHELLVASQKIYSKGDIAATEDFVRRSIADIKTFRLEYFEIRDAENLSEIKSLKNQNAIGLIAVWVGNVRLIDNIEYI